MRFVQCVSRMVQAAEGAETAEVSEERVAEVRRRIQAEMADKMQQDRSARAVAKAKADAEQKAKYASATCAPVNRPTMHLNLEDLW